MSTPEPTVPCPICQTPLVDGWRACPGCGTALTWREGQPVPRPTATPVVAPAAPSPSAARPSGRSRAWQLILLLVVGLCALGWISTQLNPSRSRSPGSVPFVTPTPRPLPAGQAAAAPTERPQTFTGRSIQKTKAFLLAGGTYQIAWTADGNCYHGGTLSPAAQGTGFFGELFANEVVKGSSKGSSYVYNVPAGQYYLDMNSGCSWTVTISR